MNIRIVLARIIVLFVALWPCVHLQLASQGVVSAWKLAGFGMYAVPSDKVDVVVEPCLGDKQSIKQPRGEDYRRAVSRFSAKYRAMPMSYRPDALAQLVLLANPLSNCLQLSVRHRRISAQSSRWQEKQEEFIYRRGGIDVAR